MLKAGSLPRQDLSLALSVVQGSMLPRVHHPALNALQGRLVLQMRPLPLHAGPVPTLTQVQLHVRRVSLGIRAHRALGLLVATLGTTNLLPDNLLV